MNESICCLLGIKNEKKGLATKTPRREKEKERKKERKKRKGVVVVVSFRRQKRFAFFCARGKKTRDTQMMWCRYTTFFSLFLFFKP
tara:strand:+ start:1939 stop:2196 length:258 start_codon:yes stop_codon:yes gene_type:complete